MDILNDMTIQNLCQYLEKDTFKPTTTARKSMPICQDCFRKTEQRQEVMTWTVGKYNVCNNSKLTKIRKRNILHI